MSDRPPAAWMRHEIFEQPSVLSHLAESAVPILQAVAAAAQHCDFAVLAARGSSDNASTYGKYLLEGLVGLPTALAAPSLFTLYDTPPRLQRALVIGVSQSGQAADVAAVLQEARRQGAVTLAVTNTADSLLTHSADHIVLLNAGQEHALAATKTVTAQCAVYALLAAALSGRGELQHGLAALGEQLMQVLARDEDIQRIACALVDETRVVVLGRGYCYSAAQETALKLKETCYIAAEPYSSADFVHGPLAVIEPGYPVLVLLNHDATLEMNLELVRQIIQRGASVFAFATPEAMQRVPQGCTALPVVSPTPILSNIPFIVMGQLLAMHLALLRGYNPDVSRGLRKVTITR